MAVTAVVGAQWGDEAKGKVVDLLAPQAAIVARFNGGDNAGHTVVNPHGTFKLRLTPNGFSSPDTACVIGPGVVVNLQTLLEEAATIEAAGLNLGARLWVSPRCHVVMPYHPLLEGIYESARGAAKTGTTKRGMGPVYADKVSYNGIRLFDLLEEEQFAARLKIQLALKNPILQAFGVEALDFEQVYREKLAQFDRLRPFVREPFGLVQQAIKREALVLLEGAQGALLDNNWGTYPFCTASTTLAGGASAGLGFSPRALTRVIGVVKAYTTRVGAGPLPTELFDAAGRHLAEKGREFGTVTGRARRCGWFDAELARFTCTLNGCTELALTKLDVLDGLETLRIGVGYRTSAGEQRHYWEGDAHWLASCTPETIELPGWQADTSAMRDYGSLPPQARAYVEKIEELVGVPVRMISVGPEREAMIFK